MNLIAYYRSSAGPYDGINKQTFYAFQQSRVGWRNLILHSIFSLCSPQRLMNSAQSVVFHPIYFQRPFTIRTVAFVLKIQMCIVPRIDRLGVRLRACVAFLPIISLSHVIWKQLLPVTRPAVLQSPLNMSRSRWVSGNGFMWSTDTGVFVLLSYSSMNSRKDVKYKNYEVYSLVDFAAFYQMHTSFISGRCLR